MKKFAFLAAVVCGLAAGSVQAQVTLMNQIGTDPTTLGTNIAGSQRFSDFPTFDIACGDNFTVPAGPAMSLSLVQAVMNGFNGFTDAHYTDGIITQWQVAIYSSTAAATANLTGDVANATFAFNSPNVSSALYGAVAPGQRLVSFNLSSLGINLAPGSYQLAVTASMGFAAGGQIGVVNNLSFAGTPNDNNAWQANPGGGFVIPGNFQFLAAPAQNNAYAVFANPVPEPTSMSLVGLGAAGFVVRRWRKK